MLGSLTILLLQGLQSLPLNIPINTGGLGGSITLAVLIDPDQTVAETTSLNNLVECTAAAPPR